MPRLLIAASGTGGHVFPALAVAEALPTSWQICWLGVPDRMETMLIPREFKLLTVPVAGLQGNWGKKIIRIFKLLLSTFKIRQLIFQEKIQIIFTTGGYISAPTILAAKWCGIPVILHESNAIPGKVTRFFGRFSNLVCLGFPVPEKYLKNVNTKITGMPVRKSFLSPQALPEWIPLGEGPLIVIMGGSQGAVGLNKMVSSIVEDLLINKCRIIHLTGSNENFTYHLNHKNLIIKEFSDQIPALLQHADIVISRAGAGAISELAICQAPAILVPYPYATDSHQDANAAVAAGFGAAVIVHQNESDSSSLRSILWRLLFNRTDENELLEKMRVAMKSLSSNNAEEKIINYLKYFIEESL